MTSDGQITERIRRAANQGRPEFITTHNAIVTVFEPGPWRRAVSDVISDLCSMLIQTRTQTLPSTATDWVKDTVIDRACIMARAASLDELEPSTVAAMSNRELLGAQVRLRTATYLCISALKAAHDPINFDVITFIDDEIARRQISIDVTKDLNELSCLRSIAPMGARAPLDKAINGVIRRTEKT